MKLSILSTLAMAAVVLGAQQPQKAVIVSYPNDTPDSIVVQAMDAIKAAGGMITHEYKLIKYVHPNPLPAPSLTYPQGLCCEGTCQSS
jgi:hypothetical protein